MVGGGEVLSASWEVPQQVGQWQQNKGKVEGHLSQWQSQLEDRKTRAGPGV